MKRPTHDRHRLAIAADAEELREAIRAAEHNMTTATWVRLRDEAESLTRELDVEVERLEQLDASDRLRETVQGILDAWNRTTLGERATALVGAAARAEGLRDASVPTDDTQTDEGRTTAVQQLPPDAEERTEIARRQGRTVPPDPTGINGDRSGWAQSAIAAFQEATGADDCDALADLLGDLMHWADREGPRGDPSFTFDSELARGTMHYEAETSGQDD